MEPNILEILRAELKNIVVDVFREFRAPVVPDFKIEEKMDRRKSAKFLDVSYQTMYNWTRDGVVKEHGYGRKKFYLRSELIEAMKNTGNSGKNCRSQ